jgi:hypothetical protein
MTFNLKHAQALIKHYQYLLGRDMQNGDETPVTEIAAAPAGDDELRQFFVEYKKTKDAVKALHAVRHDNNQLQVVLLNEEDDKIDLWEELDAYLQENKLDRVYLNPGFFDR